MAADDGGLLVNAGLHTFLRDLQHHAAKRKKRFDVFLPKAVRKALKPSAERPPPTQTLQTLVLQHEQDRRIEPVAAEVLRASFVLKSQDPSKTQHATTLARDLADVREAWNTLNEMEWPGWGNPFRQEITPQNAASLGLQGYFKIIDQAMSLDTMRDKFKAKEYTEFALFQADVGLMIRNAQTFNRPGEPVHGFANDVARTFKSFLKKRKKRKREDT